MSCFSRVALLTANALLVYPFLVATESAGSSVTVEPPHISDVDDYNNCHLSHGKSATVEQPHISDLDGMLIVAYHMVSLPCK